jgi:hypothetical protein
MGYPAFFPVESLLVVGPNKIKCFYGMSRDLESSSVLMKVSLWFLLKYNVRVFCLFFFQKLRGLLRQVTSLKGVQFI